MAIARLTAGARLFRCSIFPAEVFYLHTFFGQYTVPETVSAGTGTISRIVIRIVIIRTHIIRFHRQSFKAGKFLLQKYFSVRLLIVLPFITIILLTLLCTCISIIYFMIVKVNC